MKFRAVHFDLDGVIADSEHLHQAAEEQTCIDYGLEVDQSVWNGKLKGKTSLDIFSYLIENYGDPKKHDPKDLVEHKTKIIIEMYKTKLEPIEGVNEFLTWARQNFEKISLVTSSNSRLQAFVSDHLDINHFFDAVVNGDDITKGKPSPEPYAKALQKLDLAGEESLVIEDSINGIRSAKAAGCSVLAIATSHTMRELEATEPDYIAEDYNHARELLS